MREEMHSTGDEAAAGEGDEKTGRKYQTVSRNLKGEQRTNYNRGPGERKRATLAEGQKIS